MNAAKAKPQTKIIVGICSARTMHDRREAVRHLWMAEHQPGIHCLFFVGGRDPLPDEPDTIALACSDDYEELPGKVLEFLKYSCEHWDFEWLFKCNDDTYLALGRLQDLLETGVEIIGNELADERGSPSARAGYLLSRRVVELLANEGNLLRTGEEDVLIGEASVRLGATFHGTSRLCWNSDQFPAPDNDIISSHWSDCEFPPRDRTFTAPMANLTSGVIG